MRNHDAPTLWIATGLISALGSMSTGAALTWLSEALRKEIRSAATGGVYAITVASFGGITQPLLAWLIHVTHQPLAPAYYLMATTLVGLAAMIAMTETAPGKLASQELAAKTLAARPWQRPAPRTFTSRALSGEPMNSDDQKRAAGKAAAALVSPGMVVGLGTGSTAAWFVKALAARKLDVRGVPTSLATAELALSLGMTVVELDDVAEIDLTVDGADEIGPGLALIKGGGAALLREKLVWEASRRCVVIADAAKQVRRLGAYPLPIEVVGFGHRSTALSSATPSPSATWPSPRA